MEGLFHHPARGASGMKRGGRGAGAPSAASRRKPRRAGSSGIRVAFSLDTFFWRRKRKSLARGCEYPHLNGHAQAFNSTVYSDISFFKGHVAEGIAFEGGVRKKADCIDPDFPVHKIDAFSKNNNLSFIYQ